MGVGVGVIDKLTLEYTFDDENFNEILLPDQTINNQQIYWIILDCEVDTILKRIPSRPRRGIWETRKALSYFQQRFRHLSAHFGIPFINTTQLTVEQVYDEVINIVRQHSYYYRSYRQLGTQVLTYDIIQEYDIENQLYQMIDTCEMDEICNLPEYAQEFDNTDKRKLYVRSYVNNYSREINKQEKNLLRIGDYKLRIECALFRLVTEGESKKVYKDVSGNPFTKDLAFIILKSTIYSHSMQVTGEINHLGSIRACGSQLFMEMMWRNGLKHSYRSINSKGIIISDFIEEITPVEIIVKRYCEGTDKNSFYDILENENIVLTNSHGEYKCGPYVRLDWRNPNHISPKTKKALNKNLYYYLYEQAIGKEEFFKKILTNKQYAIPVGDKNISEDLLIHVIDIKQTKLSVLKMFMVIQSNGEQFWSEINQDCMRMTMIDNNENKFDKDIWQTGGSSLREQILQKWNDFNRIFTEYFMKNKFHRTELINYNSYFDTQQIHQLLMNKNLKIPRNLQDLWSAIQGKNLRRVLVTMDMFDGQPVLVKSSQLCQIHSDGDYRQAMEKLSIFPDILIVDLNGAFGEIDTQNRPIIKDLARKYYIHTGGGLRSLTDLEDILKSGVRRCVMATAEDTLIEKIPKDRLIVEISINEQNEVLIHGRRTNTHVDIITRVNQLIEIGVNVISITFVQTEGHLSGIPRQQIRDLLLQIPHHIEKIYLGGGISTLDDLEYVWAFPRVIPLLGSAIWKNKLTIGSIFNRMINFDENGTVPAIIQGRNGLVKGLCYMNPESVAETCEKRKLYRYSRKLRRLIMKGETSADIQHVIEISLDCDCDCDTSLITVDSTKPFCHTGHHSCFYLQTSIKTNLTTLADHIKSKITTDSYTGRIQRNPQLALTKIMEEFWEVVAGHQDSQISECSDLFVHLIMYLNGMNISIEDICNELNVRRWIVRNLIEQNCGLEEKPKEIIIGITNSKYTYTTDRFAEEELGIKIIRHSGRNVLVNTQIIDQKKFSKHFGNDTNMKLSLLASKPKDLIWLLASKRVTHIITFEPVVKNYPHIYSVIHEIIDPTICLALLCRQGACIEPNSWTQKNKALIASEYICQVTHFFKENQVNHHTYHLDRITEASEGFLINTDKYLLADAIVESGRTLAENHLVIWKIIIPKGQIHLALYGYCD